MAGQAKQEIKVLPEYTNNTLAVKLFFFFLSWFIYVEKDRDSVSKGEAEKEERENPKQDPHCRHRAGRGVPPRQAMRSRPESQALNRLSHPGTPGCETLGR